MDANVIVGELLRRRGQARFEALTAQLCMTPKVFSEATYELERRLEPLARQAKLSDAEKRAWLLTALNLLRRRVAVVSEAAFSASFEAQARLRVPQDPDDVPTVALALALNAGVWTEDRDFFGCGLPVWRTDVLYAALDQDNAP